MSVASAGKAYLVGESGVLAALVPTGFKVHYSAPRDILRDIVYAGDVTGPVELKAFAGGGRVRRSEELTFPLVVRVWMPGKNSCEAADARAETAGDVISDYIAANWTFGGLTDLKKAEIASMSLAGWVDDDGAGSVLIMVVRLTSYRS